MKTLSVVIKIRPTPENQAQPTKEFVADRRWRDLGFIIYSTRYTADRDILVTISKTLQIRGMAQRIAIIALTCDRIDEAFQTWHHNLKDTPYLVYWWDNSQIQANRDKLTEMAAHFDDRIIHVSEGKAENIGIAKALNNLMRVAFSFGHEVCVTMADDLVEAHDYPRLLTEALDMVPNTGIAASPPSEGSLRYERQSTNGIRWETGDVIGNWAIPKTTFDSVGPLPEYYGIYGPIDLDYCARVRKAGLLPIYRSDITSRHLGVSTPQTHAYEKQVSLNNAWPIYSQKMRELEA